MIEAVVFDLDDTLYLERDYVKSGFLAVDLFLQKQDVHGFFSAAWTYFEAGGRGNTFNEVLDQLIVSYDKADILELISVYRQHKPTINMLPDATDIVAELKGQYHLGLITDGYSVAQNNKVDALGLRRLLDKIVVTDDLGAGSKYWKPHVLSYETVQRCFSVPHDRCLYVGDNVQKDFIAAKKLGWKTIQICRENSEYNEQDVSDEYCAHYQIKSMNELPEIISGL